MKISIALCTYNGEKFLLEQLESFLTQTRLPEELIVCDDCSTDASIELINNFAKTSPFPVLLHRNEKNLGSTGNFEKAISLCSGDLIFLSDQDDVWVPDKIKIIEAEFAKNNKLGLVFTNAELVDESLHPLESTLWDFSFPKDKQQRALAGKMFEVLLHQNVVTGATIAFRTNLRELFSPIPTGIPYLIHDAWIALVVAANAEVGMLSESLIKYRQHSNQQLGVGLNKKETSNRNESYAEPIALLQNDQIRLAKIIHLLETFPPFQTRKYLLDDNFIGNLMKENDSVIAHYEAQKNLSATKTQRILSVFQELKTGRYQRSSKGFMSAAKDLLKSRKDETE